MHVEHRLGDRIHGLERLEAAEHDAVRRRPQEAADDGARLLRDHERGIEPVEARLDAEPSEQPEREVVLGLVGGEKRAGPGQERVGVGDPGRNHSPHHHAGASPSRRPSAARTAGRVRNST